MRQVISASSTVKPQSHAMAKPTPSDAAKPPQTPRAALCASGAAPGGVLETIRRIKPEHFGRGKRLRAFEPARERP